MTRILVTGGRNYANREHLTRHKARAKAACEAWASHEVSEAKAWRRYRELKTSMRVYTTPRKRDDWDEGDGPVLWWRFPVCEPPYVGDPRDDDFPEYVTHWTPIFDVEEP